MLTGRSITTEIVFVPALATDDVEFTIVGTVVDGIADSFAAVLRRVSGDSYVRTLV